MGANVPSLPGYPRLIQTLQRGFPPSPDILCQGLIILPSWQSSWYRMYYQLCLHRVARFYGPHCAIRVRLDSGADCKDVCNMRNQLCADAYRTYRTRPNCVRAIEPVCSTKANIVQMADVILGAIAAKRNNISYARPDKAELAAYVLEQSGHSDWSIDTPKSARFLTVWNHKSKG